MSKEQSQSKNIDAICAGCKSDLAKEPHKEDCTIISSQKLEKMEREAEAEKQEQQKIIDQKIEEAKEELNKKVQEDVTKITKELEKAKSETNVLALKNKVIDKIIGLVPDEKFSRQELLDLSINDLGKVYGGVLKLVREEAAGLKYNVTCPICLEKLGGAKTIEQAKIVQRKHKAERHPAKGGGWIALAIISSFILAGAIAGWKVYRNYQSKKKGSESK